MGKPNSNKRHKNMSLWVTDSSSDDDDETEEVVQVVPPPKKKTQPPKKAQKKQVAPSTSHESPSKKSSNQSVQQKDRRKSKHNENFNQKPAKVKKNRKTSQNESNEGIQIETNVIQPIQEDKTARNSTRQVSKVSMRDIETQNEFDHKEDESQVKCLLSFILFFTIVTCGFIVYLFY